MKANVEKLDKLAGELLSLMSVNAKIETSYDKENETYVVNIDAGEENGLLIGKKGETLSSLQIILGILFKQEMGEWYRVMVNIADYREKEEDYLKNLAAATVERVRSTGEPQNLYNLKPWQRRVVHMFLAEEDGITTESEGEGEERYLVIKLKK